MISMTDFLWVIASIINKIHDGILLFTSRVFTISVTDKSLHFWLIGFLGILIFLMTDIFFKRLAKWSISISAFIYTITILIVLVFGLEVEQKITGQGNMEFQDVVYGLWGFFAIFSFYLCIRAILCLMKRLPFRSPKN